MRYEGPMATAEHPTLLLERFAWSAPDRLELVGRWSGLEIRSAHRAVLVAIVDGAERRIEALEGPRRFVRGSRWSASFPWDPDDGLRVSEARLHMGEALVVDLPRPSTGPRRFGRPRLEARFQEPELKQSGEAVSDAGSLAESPLDLHTRLVRVREELEEARALLEQAQDETAAARRLAEREMERRRSESVRMRDALSTAQSLAEEQFATERRTITALREELDAARSALDEERRAMAALRPELEESRARLEAEREAIAELRAEVQDARSGWEAERQTTAELRAEVDESRAGLEAERQTTAALRAELEESSQDISTQAAAMAQLQRQLAESGDALSAERRQRSGVEERLQELQSGLEQVRDRERQTADRLGAELASTTQQLEAARADLRRRAEETERLRGRVLDAERLNDLVERLTAELTVAQGEAREASELRSVLEERNDELSRATADREALARRLRAVRDALDELV